MGIRLEGGNLIEKWFDVHFSLDGFVKVEAEDEDGAVELARENLEAERYMICKVCGGVSHL